MLTGDVEFMLNYKKVAYIWYNMIASLKKYILYDMIMGIIMCIYNILREDPKEGILWEGT